MLVLSWSVGSGRYRGRGHERREVGLIIHGETNVYKQLFFDELITLDPNLANKTVLSGQNVI